MLLSPKESPVPPHTFDIFLFFCDEQEKFKFLDFVDELGTDVLDEGKLEEKDKQECSICGRGSHATLFVYIQLQKPNFGGAILPEEAGF